MDKLLKLFEKYNCHLKRGDKTSAEFLRENYDEYIMDVKASLAPEDNPLYGAEMCSLVSEQLETIEKTSDQLIEVLVLYGEGKIIPASPVSRRAPDHRQAAGRRCYHSALRKRTAAFPVRRTE